MRGYSEDKAETTATGGPYSSGASSINVTSSARFPASGVFSIETPAGETIIVGAVSGLTWSSLTRGANGTTAATINPGDLLKEVVSAFDMEQMLQPGDSRNTLAALADVDIVSPTAGQVVAWDAGEGKYTAQDVAGISDATTATPGLVKVDHAPSGPDPVALTTDGTVMPAGLLGTTGTKATAGNDARLSDARMPAAHHTTHENGGSDQLSLAAGQIVSGAFVPARLPVATPTDFGAVKPDGTSVTVSAGVLSASLGGAADATTVTPGLVKVDHAPSGAHPIALTTDGLVMPSGLLGTTSSKAAAGNDSRLSNSRTPTGAAGGHLGGTYPDPTVDHVDLGVLDQGGATDGEVLTWDATTGQYMPAVAPNGGYVGGDLTVDGLLAIEAGTPTYAGFATAIESLSGLILYWRLDEASGTTVSDSSGNSRTGTYQVGATLNQTGATPDGNKAIGVSALAANSTATGLPTGAGARTLGIFFKTTSSLAQALAGYGTTVTDRGFRLGLDSSTVARVGFYNVGLPFPLPRPVADNAYHWLIATYDGTNVTVYLDGHSVGSQVHTSANTADAGLRLGQGPTGANAFHGSLDEVFLVNRALSQSEITALAAPSAGTGDLLLGTSGGATVLEIDSTGTMLEGIVPPARIDQDGATNGQALVWNTSLGLWLPGAATGSIDTTVPLVLNVSDGLNSYPTEVLADSPILYWRLEEISGTTLTDSSGNGRTGALAGTAGTNYVLGVTGALAAGDLGVHVGNLQIASVSSSGFPTGASVRSVECWVRGAISGQNQPVICNWGTAGVAEENFTFFIDGNGAYIAVNDCTFTLGPSYALDDWQWHHIMATFDGTNLGMYFDGIYLGAKQFSSTLNTVLSADGFTLGDRNNNAGHPLTADVDEVAVYATCLSATRVTAHYRAGREARFYGKEFEAQGDSLTSWDVRGTGDVELTGSLNLSAPYPLAAPTAAKTGSGSDNLGVGTYQYAVVFMNETGWGYRSPNVSVATDSTHKKVQLTDIPVAPVGLGVTSRGIVRSLVGNPDPAKFVAIIPDNHTTSYLDNVADGSLFGDIYELHGGPPIIVPMLGQKIDFGTGAYLASKTPSGLVVAVDPTAPTNHGGANNYHHTAALAIGAGSWSGRSEDFSGSQFGTMVAVNAPSGFTGNLYELEIAGSSKAWINAAGVMEIASFLSTGGAFGAGDGNTLNGKTYLGAESGGWALTADPGSSNTAVTVRGATGGSGDLFNVFRGSTIVVNTRPDGLLTASLGVATKTKAGVPADADWTTAPPDGTLVVDTSDDSLRFRSSGTWHSTAGGGGSSTLAADTDVSITSPADKDLLTYETSSGLWKNKVLPTAGTSVLGAVKVDGTSIVISSGVISASGASGSTTLAGDTDVNIPSPANGDVLTFNSGTSKWISSAPSGGGSTDANNITTPTTSGWSWVNQGSATVNNTSTGIFLSASDSSDSIKARVQALGTAAFTLVAELEAPIFNDGTETYGLIIRVSGSSNFLAFGFYSDTTTKGLNLFQGPGTSNAITGLNLDKITHTRLRWLKIVDDGVTNRTYSVSVDGANWVQVYQAARTQNTTGSADQIGFFTNPRTTNQELGVLLRSWSLT